MYIPKRYGESKTNKCPFCEKDAFSQNKQKIPTCKEHKETLLQEVKCVCGSWLDMREGKYGIFFTCINCGALNLRKVLEMNNVQKQKTEQTANREQKLYIRPKTLQEVEQEQKKSKEITISSEELDFI